ncbi:YIP1 family protein [Xinfangfangia sp. D13-10-4-6]|uniref:YIP1 family protein n=1 Tax=Pseudogemmobacter hezensis TaxID=2737662 RepID=UPI0015567A71|nr:YIP1 family protein [Pseudogemmobacter hezensis]NPD16930.1 YIP1 family protein [Pseudogemmobacter hezensis]
MISWLTDTFLLTFTAPRAAMRRVLSLQRGPGAETLALLLVTVCGALISGLATLMITGSDTSLFGWLLEAPLVSVAMQFGSSLLGAVLIWAGGKRFGGTGSLKDGVLVIAWLDFVMLITQLVLVLALFAGLPLPGIAGPALVLLLLVLLSSFIAEMHGFQSVAKTLLGVILGFFLVVMILSVLLVALIPREALLNVI